MNRLMTLVATCAALLSPASPALTTSALAQQLALRGDIVHTMAGEAIEDGVVLSVDGKITAVGPASDITIPDGYTVVHGPVVTPGLVDAHTVVGLAG